MTTKEHASTASAVARRVTDLRPERGTTHRQIAQVFSASWLQKQAIEARKLGFNSERYFRKLELLDAGLVVEQESVR